VTDTDPKKQVGFDRFTEKIIKLGKIWLHVSPILELKTMLLNQLGEEVNQIKSNNLRNQLIIYLI